MKVNFYPIINFRANIHNINSTAHSNSHSKNRDVKSGELSNVYYSPLQLETKENNEIFKEELKNLPGIHCPISGTKMVTKEEYDEIIEKAKSINNIAELSEFLKEHEENILPKYRHIVGFSKTIAEDRPELDMKSFLKLANSGANKNLKKIVNSIVEELGEKQTEQEMSNSDKELLSEGMKRLSELNEKTGSKIFPLREFKNIMLNTVGKMEDENKWAIYEASRKKVRNASLYQFLFVYNYEDSQAGKSPYEKFIENLFKPSIGNVVKICQNLENGDKNYNQILISQFYVNDKATVEKRLKEKNAGVKTSNVQQYFDDIGEAIVKGKLISDTDYPKHAIGLIKKITNEKINFKKSEVLVQVSSLNLSKRQEKIDFNIVNFDNVPCACCGKPTINHEHRCNLFDEIADTKNLKELQTILKDNIEYIRPKYKQLVKDYNKLLAEKPNISGNDMLTKLREIYHKKVIDEIKLSVLEINKLKKQEKLSSNDLILINRYISETERNFINYPKDAWFPFSDYNKMITKTLRSMESRNSKKFVGTAKHNVLEKHIVECLLFPHERAIEKFDNPMKIVVQDILKMSVATMEHCYPLDRGGRDERKNLVVYCKDCNGEKSSNSFLAWQKLHPNMAENMQKYLNFVMDLIMTGALTDYDDYPQDLSEYMELLSRRNIVLKVSKEFEDYKKNK